MKQRVVLLLKGYSRGLQTVKYRCAYEALKLRIPNLEIWDIDIVGLPRAAHIVKSFRFDRRLWRETFYSHPASFDDHGRIFARRLANDGKRVDAFVTFGLSFDVARFTNKIPVIAYADYTTALSARNGAQFRHPLTGAVSRRRIDQEKHAMAFLDAICTRSQYVADAIARDYGIDKAKILAIGGGSNLPFGFTGIDRPNTRSSKFLFVGNAFFRKGGDIVLTAFERLHKDLPDAELTMVTRDAPKTLPEGVTVLSAPDQETYELLFKESNIFVLGSRFETWGDVLIEAMSVGIPCICPDIRPLDEIVRDGVNGRRFLAGDAESLYRAMKDLSCHDEKREVMSRNAREQALERFNWDVVMEKLSRVVKKTIDSKVDL